MKTGIKGINLIKEIEGLRLHAYYDLGGVLTIGYGHTNNTASAGTYPVYPGETITEDQAILILKADLVTYESAVNNAVTRKITQNQFDALVSFTYNLGAGTLYSSDLLKYVNEGNFNAAANEFQYYCHGNGKVIPGLVRRRSAEKALFLDNSSDNYSSQTIYKNKAIDKMINWMKERLGKVTYSMTYRNGPNSYDCSSAVYHALVAGGFLPVGSNGNTDSEFGALERNGWSIVSKSQDGRVHPLRGDIFIWGVRGASTGAFGHTGIFYDDNDNIIHCNYGYNGITINNYDNIWNYNDNPEATIYRYTGNNNIPQHSNDVTPASGTYTFKQTTNIRTSPSLSSTIVGQYTAGESVIYNGKLNVNGYTWLRYISYSGRTLYVASLNGNISSSNSGTYVFNQTTNIRTAPNTSSEIVGQFQAGDTVNYNNIIHSGGYSWLQYVSYSGKTLYAVK
ncbi:SH3 domain-containing protein [Fructilactobacillus hinvesii]|uniref:Lysozyme n=1 Tax=Fructilactobacillus hinvesii TaxID=2940300 RepID=A0ABY5BWZ9_9LACO|nr:peptidoglycan amidohydrolase family protein [Fructilactobacillus hinvesii]USS88183.1 SH3 domain-containing protein [Fructilactobacillus hinvesii]